MRALLGAAKNRRVQVGGLLVLTVMLLAMRILGEYQNNQLIFDYCKPPFVREAVVEIDRGWLIFDLRRYGMLSPTPQSQLGATIFRAWGLPGTRIRYWGEHSFWYFSSWSNGWGDWSVDGGVRTEPLIVCLVAGILFLGLRRKRIQPRGFEVSREAE